MKFIASAVCCLVLIAASSLRAENRFDLFVDQAMTQCALADHAPGTQTIHVFLSGSEAATFAVLSAPRPDCWQGASWVGDVMPGNRAWTGNTQIGIGVTLYVPGIAECKTPPVLVCSMLFVASGTSQPCCDYVVAPASLPQEPYGLEYIDCAFLEHPASVGRKVTINPDPSCRCELPLATESSTWGRVKALYRN